MNRSENGSLNCTGASREKLHVWKHQLLKETRQTNYSLSIRPPHLVAYKGKRVSPYAMPSNMKSFKFFTWNGSSMRRPISWIPNKAHVATHTTGAVASPISPTSRRTDRTDRAGDTGKRVQMTLRVEQTVLLTNDPYRNRTKSRAPVNATLIWVPYDPNKVIKGISRSRRSPITSGRSRHQIVRKRLVCRT